VAKAIGYSIGTLYNVFGSYDQLILAINGARSTSGWSIWRPNLTACLAAAWRAAIDAYFDFAMRHRNAWTALYDFRLPESEIMPEEYQRKVTAITDVVVREIAAALSDAHVDKARGPSPLAARHGPRSLLFRAQRHFFALLGEEHPLAAALDRVDDALARYR